MLYFYISCNFQQLLLADAGITKKTVQAYICLFPELRAFAECRVEIEVLGR